MSICWDDHARKWLPAKPVRAQRTILFFSNSCPTNGVHLNLALFCAALLGRRSWTSCPSRALLIAVHLVQSGNIIRGNHLVVDRSSEDYRRHVAQA
jgi:hypothetical protein